MGRSTTPTYRIEFSPNSRCSNMVWKREYGRPTDKNLALFIDELIISAEIGGVNAHLGGMIRPDWARIIHQQTGVVVANYSSTR